MVWIREKLIPDPRSRGQKGTGSRIWIRSTTLFCLCKASHSLTTHDAWVGENTMRVASPPSPTRSSCPSTCPTTRPGSPAVSTCPQTGWTRAAVLPLRYAFQLLWQYVNTCPTTRPGSPAVSTRPQTGWTREAVLPLR
jgi:hypothetical protein